VARLKGAWLDERDYDADKVISGEDVDVYRPDETLLLAFRHRVLTPGVCTLAYDALKRAARPTDSRRNVARGEELVASGIFGYQGRTYRHPYCHVTAFTRDEPELWGQLLPLIRAVDGVFRATLPAQYEELMAAVRRASPDFVISGTAFSSGAANRSLRCVCHRDQNNLKGALSAMTVVQAGSYTGGRLVFPRYRVAVDMRSRDVLLADVANEWHGNTAIVGSPGPYERLTCVLYFHAAMLKCGSAAEELRRAQGCKHSPNLDQRYTN
jgi:hypothetical protein